MHEGQPGGQDGWHQERVNIGLNIPCPRLPRLPWRRKCQPTSVFLPRKSHGQRSLVVYSPWGCKELDTTEQLHFHIPCPRLPRWH